MKRILIFFAIIAGSTVTGRAQLLKSSYFMEGSIVRDNLNPAFRPTRGYINIPVAGALAVEFGSGFAVDDLLYSRGGKLVTFLDPSVNADEFYESIGLHSGRNYNFDLGLTTNIIGTGFYMGRSFFSLTVDGDVALGAAIPGDLFRFLKSGSGAGGHIFDLSSTALAVESTGKIALGYSFKLPLGLTVGARVAYKMGLFRTALSFDKFDAVMEPNRWSIDAKSVLDVVMPFSGTPEFIDANGKVDFSKIQETLFNSLKRVRPIGAGFSFDIGAEYNLGFIKLSASLLDVGIMRWNNSATWRGVATSQYSYNGFNVENGTLVNNENTMPRLENLLKFESTSIGTAEKISTPMQATIVAGVEFDLLHQIIGLGLIYMDKNREFTSSSQLSANLTLRPLPWLSGALSYTFENYRNIGENSFNSFGFALNLHAPFINFFIGTDYVMTHFGKIGSIPVPVSQKYFNFYLGIAVPLGKGKI